MIKNLMLVAVAAMAFVGCSQVEIEEAQRPIEERYFTLNIETENDVTRTYVDGTEIKWNEQGETIGVLARGYNAETADWGAYNKCVQSSEATLNENIASFTANIPVISDWNNNGIEATQYAVAAIYPYSDMGASPQTQIQIELPSTQTPVQGSYDPAADILVSKQEKIFDAVGDNTSVNFKFGRLVSIVEMTVKGIPAGEKISTIEVSASKALSGFINYKFIVDDDHEMEFDDRLYIQDYGTQGVTLNMNDLEATGEDKVWFTTLPQDLANGSIQVVVKTDVGTYFADINLSGKQLNLKRADINRFAVTVSAPQPEHFVFTEAEAYVTNFGYEGYAYYTVTFKNETSQFETEFYTHKTAIESGEWLMDSSKADGTLYTNATLNYNAVSTEGKATVVRDGENYTINFTDLYYNNIIPFTAEFEGTIAINNGNMGAEFVADYTATQWLWLGATSGGWSTNSYAVSGENLSVDLHFYFSQATETSLAEGWYNWVSDGNMIYSYYPYNFAIKNGLTINGTAITPVSGSAEVIANNETEYTINLTFTDDANNVYKIQYVGALNVKEEVEIDAIPVVSMTTGATQAAGYNYTYTFTVDDNTFFSLVFSEWVATATSITAGDYTNVAYPSYVQRGNFSIDTSKNYKFNGVKVKPAEASTVKVSVDGDIYTILMNFVFSDGTLVYVYEGKIGGTSGGNEEPVEPTKLATPVVNIDIVRDNQATLSWNAIAGAGSYTVTYSSETTTETTTVDTNEVILSNLAWDTTYTVTVVANPADETLNYASDASIPVNVVVEPDPNAGGGDEPGTGSGDESVTYDPWACNAVISGGDFISGFTVTLTGTGDNKDVIVLSPVKMSTSHLTVSATRGEESVSGKAYISENDGKVYFEVTIGDVTYIGTSTNSVA